MQLNYVNVDQNETITLYQPLLYSIAYKMVGTVMDAEDIVQDTFLKWLKTEQRKINNTKAYLIKSVTNTCINHINQLNKKKENLLDSINHPSFIDKIELPNFDFKNELSEAIGILLKKLEPSERAVFVLREIFNFDYTELTEILDKKKENCRQLLCRAKEKLNQEKDRFNVNLDVHTQFVDKFKGACTFGEVGNFIENLKNDISAKLNHI
ncbi:sigma-70 family RNA polymerase sigma factor [Fulvivirgaceae bacterium BMA12]|uniref:Sigma-70 family RNA polymerase sigma factor n=1 Tax=Agaribacillus aureus TaxID=3051825 RepID=A0ABT8L908_9BACT|nr:sigma-70 family RNA polymerase sigma factor [Fulvivirgaceae bacterium BMA12]